MFQNLGETPGIVRDAFAQLRLVTNDHLPDVDLNALPHVFAQMIVPGKILVDAAQLPGAAVDCPPFNALNREQQDLLHSDTKDREGRKLESQRFYLFCKVVYDDFFGMRHTASYCFKVRHGGYHGAHGGLKYNWIISEPAPGVSVTKSRDAGQMGTC